MKTTDFKLWDVFTDHMTSKLSVVVAIDSKYVHVISNKPSIYSLRKHDKEVCYEVLNNKLPEEIFREFKVKMKGAYEKKTLELVLADFKLSHKNQNKRKLLLLLQ